MTPTLSWTLIFNFFLAISSAASVALGGGTTNGAVFAATAFAASKALGLISNHAVERAAPRSAVFIPALVHFARSQLKQINDPLLV